MWRIDPTLLASHVSCLKFDPAPTGAFTEGRIAIIYTIGLTNRDCRG